MLRLLPTAPLLFALILPARGEAQDPKPAAPKFQEPAEEAAQEPQPARPKEPTPEERLEELRAEKERLEREIRYARERAQRAKQLLQEKLGAREQSFRAIDAGTAVVARPTPQPAQPVQRKFARIASAEERQAQPDGAMVVVEGRAISQSWFDRVMGYLSESGAAIGDESVRAQRVLFDMMRIEGVAAQFEENDAELRLAEALAALEAGKSLADVARAEGSVLAAAEDGRVEVTRNSMHGPYFEHVAFTTPVGQTARPFRNASGYVLLHVDALEKGDSPQQDKVVCHVAQFDYTEDAEALRKAQFKVNSGQVDVVVRDEQVLEMLPALFRETRAQLLDPKQLRNQLTELEAQLQKLRATGEGESDAAEAIQTQIQKLEAALERAGKAVEAEVDPGKLDSGKLDPGRLDPGRAEGGRRAPASETEEVAPKKKGGGGSRSGGR